MFFYNTNKCYPRRVLAGYRIVLYGGLNGKLCSADRYQPFLFWTNGSSDCTFQKSLCKEEGQLISTERSTSKDATCRCDNSRGYSFVLQPKHTTYCLPSEEDCSCYIQQCVDGKILNAGTALLTCRRIVKCLIYIRQVY